MKSSHIHHLHFPYLVSPIINRLHWCSTFVTVVEPIGIHYSSLPLPTLPVLQFQLSAVDYSPNILNRQFQK